jgi:hypothetical protein
MNHYRRSSINLVPRLSVSSFGTQNRNKSSNNYSSSSSLDLTTLAEATECLKGCFDGYKAAKNACDSCNHLLSASTTTSSESSDHSNKCRKKSMKKDYRSKKSQKREAMATICNTSMACINDVSSQSLDLQDLLLHKENSFNIRRLQQQTRRSKKQEHSKGKDGNNAKFSAEKKTKSKNKNNIGAVGSERKKRIESSRTSEHKKFSTSIGTSERTGKIQKKAMDSPRTKKTEKSKDKAIMGLSPTEATKIKNRKALSKGTTKATARHLSWRPFFPDDNECFFAVREGVPINDCPASGQVRRSGGTSLDHRSTPTTEGSNREKSTESKPKSLDNSRPTSEVRGRRGSVSGHKQQSRGRTTKRDLVRTRSASADGRIERPRPTLARQLRALNELKSTEKELISSCSEIILQARLVDRLGPSQDIPNPSELSPKMQSQLRETSQRIEVARCAPVGAQGRQRSGGRKAPAGKSKRRRRASSCPRNSFSVD